MCSVRGYLTCAVILSVALVFGGAEVWYFVHCSSCFVQVVVVTSVVGHVSVGG